jgi:5'(3')-deoxyribonucleotidase
MKFFELANKEQTSRPVVYVDMDGTITDFFGSIAKHHGVSHWRKARKKQKIDKIARNPGFFKNLAPLKNAGKLIKNVIKLAGKYSILSSPLMSNVEQSSQEKTEWLRNHLNKLPPESVLFDHQKEKYALQSDGTPNILIDDWDTNINLWRKRGGIGILYDPDNIDTVIKELNNALHGKAKQVNPAQDVPFLEDDGDKLYTSRDVLGYIKDIHHDYSLDDPVLKHKTWMLKNVPIEDLKDPEFYDQDDPYRRVIDLDWDHIDNISGHDIKNRPIVVDDNGWVLDGNHRVTAARARGMSSIPAYLPVK